MRVIVRVPAPAVSPAWAVLGGVLAAGAILYALVWMVLVL